MKAFTFFLAAFVALTGIILATDRQFPAGESAPPDGPLIRAIPDASAWRITYTFTDSEKLKPENQDPSSPVSITIVKAHSAWIVTVLRRDGNSSQTGSDGQDCFYIPPGLPDAILVGDPEDEKAAPPLFPDFEWLTPETYAGRESLHDRECLVFRKDEMIALVDAQTRFPVLWKKGIETRLFTELPKPSVPITLPPEMRKVSIAAKKDRERLRIPPPTGG